MVIKGKTINLKDLTRNQLLAMDDALESFIFKESHLFLKGEPFADTYKKDKEHFKQIISLMVSFKRALMGYFQKQYDNRDNLVQLRVLAMAEEDAADDDSIYIYLDQWAAEDDTLAQILQNYKAQAYDLGIGGYQQQTQKDTDHSSQDAGIVLLKKSQTVSQQINETTKKRIIKALKTSLELGETRDEFEQRLKKILINTQRGRFIAQNEALQSYLDGKDEAATKEETITKKTWIGVQPDPSEICGQVLNETVGINDPFSNGLDGPLAHLGCKCDLVYS